MRVLRESECRSWCAEHRIGITESGHPEIPSAESIAAVKIPGDTGQRIALVRNHMENIQSAPAVLVWMTEWGVWPSSERMHIFDRFRLSFGVTTSLHEHPGHLFSGEEFEDVVSTVTLAALFLWDCCVVVPESGIAVFYSHDEHGFIRRAV